jgi:hypothetical protein
MSMQKQLLVVLLIALSLVGLWFMKQDSTANYLNGVLRVEPAIQAYPYNFHVIKFENGIATMSTPRSAQVSVLHFFKYAFPNLDIANPDSETMIQAQKQLADVQEKAAKIVKSQPMVKEIQWEIDRDWYKSHGILVD